MKNYIIIVTLCLTPCIVIAQGGPPIPGCWPPPCVPIDGGVTIFGLIAAFFAHRSLSKNK